MSEGSFTGEYFDKSEFTPKERAQIRQMLDEWGSRRGDLGTALDTQRTIKYVAGAIVLLGAALGAMVQMVKMGLFG